MPETGRKAAHPFVSEGVPNSNESVEDNKTHGAQTCLSANEMRETLQR